MQTDSEKTYVLITGASRGIGRAIAKAFAKNGYSLILCCKKHISELKDFASELEREYKITVKAFACNVGDEASVNELFMAIEKECLTPGILINNAGIAHYGLLTDMSADEWHELMAVNLDSLFYTCKKTVPLMLRNGYGRIINISSVWGNVGASCEVAYSASKGAVNSFTKGLAKELAPSGIPVNAIACGMVNTEMNSSHLSKEEISEIAADIPADRICEPEEVADFAVKLAESPKYLTGQIITIDGGWI